VLPDTSSSSSSSVTNNSGEAAPAATVGASKQQQQQSSSGDAMAVCDNSSSSNSSSSSSRQRPMLQLVSGKQHQPQQQQQTVASADTVKSLKQAYSTAVDSGTPSVHALAVQRVLSAVNSGNVTAAALQKALLQKPAKLAKQHRVSITAGSDGSKKKKSSNAVQQQQQQLPVVDSGAATSSESGATAAATATAAAATATQRKLRDYQVSQARLYSSRRLLRCNDLPFCVYNTAYVQHYTWLRSPAQLRLSTRRSGLIVMR
jgi:hypothetical protein